MYRRGNDGCTLEIRWLRESSERSGRLSDLWAFDQILDGPERLEHARKIFVERPNRVHFARHRRVSIAIYLIQLVGVTKGSDMFYSFLRVRPKRRETDLPFEIRPYLQVNGQDPIDAVFSTVRDFYHAFVSLFRWPRQ